MVKRPGDFLLRYVAGRGTYPAEIVVRTPTGPLPLTVHGPHDAATINEIFCRLDYRVDTDIKTVVDVGANIGISAAYFLSRNPEVEVWAFEPAPQNLPRLREQLARFGDRVHIQEVAVGTEDGEVEFGVEPTGRYGSIWAPEGAEQIRVPCRDVNRVLEDVCAARGSVDVLKIDIEGYEPQVVGALRPDLARRVRTIVYEWNKPLARFPDDFEHSFDGCVNRLQARQSARA